MACELYHRSYHVVPKVRNFFRLFMMASQNTKFLVQEQGDSLVEVTTNKPVATEANEVVISLKAIAINPADVKMIDQAHRVTSWPLTPGLDGAGIVEAVGSKVSRFVVGDRVLAQFVPGDRGGSYQNFAVVAEKMVAKVPETWSLENAATLGYVDSRSVRMVAITLPEYL